MEAVSERRLARPCLSDRPPETFWNLSPIETELPEKQGRTEVASQNLEGTWFRRLVLYSLTSAICAVIPIPLLDEHLVRRTRQRLVREAAKDRAIQLADVEVAHLSGTQPATAWGRFLGCIVAQSFRITVKVVRRFFRSVLVFLTVKDAVDAFSKTFHEGFLLHSAMPDLERQLHALARHGVTPEQRSRELVPEVKTLRAAIERTFEETDTRPLEGTIKSGLRGSRRILKRAARVFVREARQAEKLDPTAEPVPDESERLAPDLYEALTRSLLRQETYLQTLNEHFRRHWSPSAEPRRPG